MNDAGAALQSLLSRPPKQANVDHYYYGVDIAYDAGKTLHTR